MDELHIVIDWTCHFDLNTMQNMINSSNLTLKNIHFNDPIINKKHVDEAIIKIDKAFGEINERHATVRNGNLSFRRG